MANNQSDELKAYIIDNSKSDRTYITLEISHPFLVDADGNPEPIRVVKDRQNLIATLEASAKFNPSEEVVFQAFAYEIKNPTQDEESTPELYISADNVDPIIFQKITEASDQSAADFLIIQREYLASDLTTPQIIPPYEYFLSEIEATFTVITGKCKNIDLTTERFPRNVYASEEFPNLSPQ